MSDRELILRRIRAALAELPRDMAADGTAEPRNRGTVEPREDLVLLFAERCGDYTATVTRCQSDDRAVATAVVAALGRHGGEKLLCAPGLTPGWAPEGSRIDDPPLPLEELDRADGVLTSCVLAIACTGTIVLDGGPGQGRRALTLVPDLHICVVPADRIVADVPEAIEALRAAVAERRAPLTLISGPSATADIEFQRVEGVHGPRRLEVIIAG